MNAKKLDKATLHDIEREDDIETISFSDDDLSSIGSYVVSLIISFIIMKEKEKEKEKKEKGKKVKNDEKKKRGRKPKDAEKDIKSGTRHKNFIKVEG